MPYQSPILAAIKRTALVLLCLSLAGANTLAGTTATRPPINKIAAPLLVNYIPLSADDEARLAAEIVAVQDENQDPAVAQNPSQTKPGISAGTATQSEQGRQYGQPGFVGEPINLNVVNADIRDILNYITEQYGVNFVIDSSVRSVPVTVNVQDVPWNIALEAVLKANRLGIESSDSILRVATTDVLAKEAETQKVINDSRLDASPLVTEFIRLNYARASGTLAQAAGSTGAFSGGSTNLSFSGGRW